MSRARGACSGPGDDRCRRRMVVIGGGRGGAGARAYSEFTQHFPRPGLGGARCRGDMARDGKAWPGRRLPPRGRRCAAVGVTNQRETVVVWDPETLETAARQAIVWQDRRTAALCRELLKEAGHERDDSAKDRAAPGSVLLRHQAPVDLRPDAPELDARARVGRRWPSAQSTRWLVARMTGGAVHATDPTNASRTLLFDLDDGDWNDELLGASGRAPPDPAGSAGQLGRLRRSPTEPRFGLEAPIGGVAGDQQAALYGQGCWEAGVGKCTYGTGAFLLLNTGERAGHRPAHGLLTTAACDAHGGPRLRPGGVDLRGGRRRSNGCGTAWGLLERRCRQRRAWPARSTAMTASTWSRRSSVWARLTGVPTRAAPSRD